MSFSPPAMTIGIMIVLIILMTCHVFDCQLMTNDQVRDHIVSRFSDNFITQLFTRVQLFLILITTPVIYIMTRRLVNYLIERRRVYNLIEKIPGPPCHPIPFLGHAGIVLDLDRTKYKHGTYAREFNSGFKLSHWN